MAKKNFTRMDATDFVVPQASTSNIAIADTILHDSSREHADIPVDVLLPNPRQPRLYFNQAQLEELAEDIKQNGLIEEIVVRRSLSRDGYFEIICGERRTRACRDFLKWESIPAQIRACTDAELLRISLAENDQREQLTPFERALAYEALRKEVGDGEGETPIRTLAALVGKNKDMILLHLNLLRAQTDVQQLIRDDPTIPLRIIDELRRVEDDASRTELIRDVRKRLYNQDDIIAIVRKYRALQAQKANQEATEIQEPAPSTTSPELRLAKRMQALSKYSGQVHKIVEQQREEFAVMSDEERGLVREHVTQWIEELRQLLG